MNDVYEEGKRVKICDLLAIIPISHSLNNIDELVEFCNQYSIEEKPMIEALKLTMRAFMSQHIQELDVAGNIGIEQSDEYYRSSGHVNHPNRPRIALLDRLANCAYERLKPMWSFDSISELKKLFDNDSKRYFEMLDSFVTENVVLVVDRKEMKIDTDFLSLGSGQFFADSVLNPRYSQVLSDYAGSFVGEGRKEYLKKIWKEYLIVVVFFYKQVLEKYFGSSYGDEIINAKDVDELWKISATLWRKTLSKLDEKLSSEKWLIRTRPDINFDEMEAFLEKNCSYESGWSAKNLDEFLGYQKLILLDGRTKYFGGPVFFIRLLLGEVEFKKLNENYTKPVDVIKLIHPTPEDGGNRFSYGVRMWSYPPGWIIFTGCGNDYSGGSRKTAREIEQWIKKVESFIIFREFEISQKELEDYATGNTTMPKGPLRELTDEEGQRVLFREARELAERVSGIIMELLVSTILASMAYYVKWSIEDTNLGEYEVDVTARKNSECLVVECSHRMSSGISFAEELVAEFNAKIDGLSKMEGYEEKEFKRIYVTRKKFFFEKRMKNVLEHLGKHQIEVTSLERIITQSTLSKNQKDKIMKILQELDCWRPGYNEWTTGSDVGDVLTCLDIRGLRFLGTIGMPDIVADEKENEREKRRPITS